MSQKDSFADDTMNQGTVATAPAKAPAKPVAKLLPPYRVLLHNDDENTIEDVVQTILMLTPLRHADAVIKTLEAHETGVALLLVTHRERAELYVEQFHSRQLSVSIEPAE
ncbi:ATP-dependent Clp protease adaptor protein ClpS [Phycisphaerae bacterium RAS2]|jgi:ATP-dependent Clp protease adaptor protein ClpS|nr:ATP-dependent Clp protease adaptor protein ClpS [Phycisphaerae bacterium RAS2]